MMTWQGETYSVVEVAPQPLHGRTDRVSLRIINMGIVVSRQDSDHVSVSVEDAKSSLTPVDATNVNRVIEMVCADANILRLFDADANSLVGRLVRRQARPKATYAMLVEDGTREMLTAELAAAVGSRRAPLMVGWAFVSVSRANCAGAGASASASPRRLSTQLAAVTSRVYTLK